MNYIKTLISRFSGLLSVGFAVVAIILMITATNVVFYEETTRTTYYGASAVLFGSGTIATYSNFSSQIGFINETWSGQASGAALTAWIFIIICAAWRLFHDIYIRVLIRIGKAQKYHLIMRAANMFSILLMVTAGVLVLTTNTNFVQSNGLSGTATLDASYITAAVFVFVSAFFGAFSLSNQLTRKMHQKLGK